MSEHKAEGGETKKKGGTLPLIIGLVLLMVGLLVAGKVVLGGKNADTKKTSKHKKAASDDEETKHTKKGDAAEEDSADDEEIFSEPAEEFVALEPEFTVNLSGGGDHYLRISISVGVRKGFTKTQLEHHLAPLRDSVITILSAKEVKQLNTPEGKKKLKKEMLKKLNKVFHEEKETVITEIAFTAFATQ
ncbi:MAG: flagellar basal body-associated FliL family protein [Armatimonadetes bacterium]|nr:flagellar basal body-associated FliL family protein [Armatimonadota bacterium]